MRYQVGAMPDPAKWVANTLYIPAGSSFHDHVSPMGDGLVRSAEVRHKYNTPKIRPINKLALLEGVD